MKRPWLLLLLGSLVLGGGLLAWRTLRSRGDSAVAEIEELGGTVRVDEEVRSRPVVAVNLTGSRVRDKDLRLLENWPHLRQLYLGGTAITDPGLARLKGLADLQELYLLDTEISDAGLVELQGLKQLQVLDLSATNVTDRGLEDLKGLNGLKDLFLAGTRVTRAGIASLQEALPDLNIHTRSF